jgi:hypothetical protein
MNRRLIEIAVMLAVALFCLLAYLGKPNILGWHEGFVFSRTVSLLIVAAIGLSLIWILIRTIQNRLVGRRTVFLYVGIAISLPLFMSLKQEIIISDEVRQVYEALQELPAGSNVLMSFDYDPASAPELQPMAEAVIGECFKRDLKVIIMGLWPMGPQQALMAVDTIMTRMGLGPEDKVYGVDYVNLGFQAGNEFVIQRMGSSFESMFKTDFRGTPYDSIPLLNNIRNFSDIDYGYNVSSGFPGTVEWVQVAVDRYRLKMGAGNTAVQAPTVYPYLSGGQLVGLMGGMNGAAEFEKLASLPGKATTFMLSQSFSHIIVIAFIIIGNVAYIRGGRKSALSAGSGG